MKKKRLIPVILIRNGWVIQSTNFEIYKNIGHPIPTIKRLSDFCSDEIIILDITKDKIYENRREDMNYEFKESMIKILQEISKVSYMPIAVGGNINSFNDAKNRIENGAEKIVINSLAIENKKEVEKISKFFGSQAVICSVDYLNKEGSYKIVKKGREILNLDPIKHSKELIECGVGEIFINSVEKDGKKTGYDIEYLKNFTNEINVPVIGCGGAGSWEDMYKLFKETKCDGIAAANIFHHVEHSVYLAKEYLSKRTNRFRSPYFSQF